jgi:outer membrane receptor protein involved in Fe transport
MSPRVVNAGISYVNRGLQVRALANYRGKTFIGTSGTFDYDTEPVLQIDLKLQYAFSKRYSAELNIANVTARPTQEYVATTNGLLRFMKQNPGTSFIAGLTGRF